MKKTTAFDTTFCATKECSKCTNEFCHYSEEDYAADSEKYDRNNFGPCCEDEEVHEEKQTSTYIDLDWLEEMENWNN